MFLFILISKCFALYSEEEEVKLIAKQTQKLINEDKTCLPICIYKKLKKKFAKDAMNQKKSCLKDFLKFCPARGYKSRNDNLETKNHILIRDADEYSKDSLIIPEESLLPDENREKFERQGDIDDLQSKEIKKLDKIISSNSNRLNPFKIKLKKYKEFISNSLKNHSYHPKILLKFLCDLNWIFHNIERHDIEMLPIELLYCHFYTVDEELLRIMANNDIEAKNPQKL